MWHISFHFDINVFIILQVLFINLEKSYVSTFQILSLDKSLEDPKRLKGVYGVLNVGILFPTVIAVLFGTLGYFAFGTMEENVLRSLPFDEV